MDCHLSGMIFWHGIAFVACLMLLVYNDQPQLLKWGKQCTSRPDHYLYFAALGPLHLIVTLSRAQPGMHHRNRITKTLIKPQQCLVGQGDLRNQHDTLLSSLQHGIDHFHIDFCLAASRNTVQKHRCPVSCIIRTDKIIRNFLLHLCQLLFFAGQLIKMYRIAVCFIAFHPQNALRRHTRYRLRRNCQLTGYHRITERRSLQQCFEEPYLCRLMFFLCLTQIFSCFVFRYRQCYLTVYHCFLLLLDGKYRFQCSDHRASIIASDPGS